MIPPAVLLDGSLIGALTQPDDAAPDHRRDAHEVFAQLLDRYERHERRLVARADQLRVVERAMRETLFGPVAGLHVAAQHRKLAQRVDGAPRGAHSMDPDLRITLVLLRQERISEVAACGDVARLYADLGLTVIGAAV